MSTSERIAVITGAGSGIGRAAAVALNGAGFTTVLIGRRPEALDATAAQVPARAIVLPADIADPAAVDRVFAEIGARCGRIDVLFNNAGTSAPAVPFEELSFAAWSAVVAVNLGGAFLCAQAAFRMMKSQQPAGGRIINNGSISAHAPRPRSAPYTATKHAMTGLTKSISLDGRPYGIACGQIDIGNAKTEMTAPMSSGIPQANGSVIAEPTMDVEAVARAVVLMATLPPDANVQFMTVMATTMPFIGRG